MIMNARHWIAVLVVGLTLSAVAQAQTTETSATASHHRYGPGTSRATADYNGDGVGFTRTQARSGRLNLARGLAVGFDRNGLSVSHSVALAPSRGPAIGRTVSLQLGLDGRGSISRGSVKADGGRQRSVAVRSAAARHNAIAEAHGDTGVRGRVLAETSSHRLGRFRGAAGHHPLRVLARARR
jgi:hypothetical protein